MSVILYTPKKEKEPTDCELFSVMGILAAISIVGGGYILYAVFYPIIFGHH